MKSSPSFASNFFSIAPYLPRKGTETLLASRHSYCRIMYRYLSTSRGAGNFRMIAATPTWLFTYRYLSTSREAGNTKVRLLSCKYLLITVQLPIYLARVRKTKQILLIVIFCTQYRYLSTSRGAGNTQPNPACSSSLRVQLPINLARGRKRLLSSCVRKLNHLYKYLSTSRGAGNCACVCKSS